MRTPLRWALALALVALVALASVQLWPGDDPASAADPVRHKEVTVARGSIRLAVTANGLVRPIDRIELKSKASGEVTRLAIEVGDRVPKGALIAQLDQVEERAALAQAEADLDIARAQLGLAEKNFGRREQLFSNKVISKQEQDQTALDLAVARSRLVQATTALERARERMEDTVIAAPVDGIILQKYVESGQIIASGVSNVGGGTPIADIANMGRVYVEAGIDEIDIGKIEVGQRASVRPEAYPGKLYEGEVVRVAPEARVEQNVTLFDVIIEVANTDGNLKSHMNADVEIVMADRSNVLTIPTAALQSAGDDPRPAGSQLGAARVLVKDGDAFVPREVRIGAGDYRVVEVLEGLQEGDVLGIPMVSRLKQEHDRLDERVRNARSFGNTGGGKRSADAGG